MPEEGNVLANLSKRDANLARVHWFLLKMGFEDKDGCYIDPDTGIRFPAPTVLAVSVMLMKIITKVGYDDNFKALLTKEEIRKKLMGD